MKKIIAIQLALVFLFSSSAQSAYYAKKEVSTGNYITRKCDIKKPKDEAGYVWEEIADPLSVGLYLEEVISYSEDALILWAYTNIFTAENMEAYRPHLAAFLSFARKATQNSADIFLAYAALSELTDVAVAIINKAIELGADITIGE